MDKIDYKLREARKSDNDIIYELLEELRGDVKIHYNDFKSYFDYILDTNSGIILLAVHEEEVVGLATFSRLPILRYAGWYYIFEELVIHQEYRRKGAVFFLLKEMLSYLRQDKEAIKVLTIYDGEMQNLLYGRYFDNVQRYVSQKFLNPK